MTTEQRKQSRRRPRKGRCWRASRERCAREGQGWEKGPPEEESAPKRANRRTGRQQNCCNTRNAEAAGRIHRQELLKATNWQPHSLRGFLSGTAGKKMGLIVVSAKGEDGERSYSKKS
jgi:hypothetical protein